MGKEIKGINRYKKEDSYLAVKDKVYTVEAKKRNIEDIGIDDISYVYVEPFVYDLSKDTFLLIDNEEVNYEIVTKVEGNEGVYQSVSVGDLEGLMLFLREVLGK